MSAGSIIVTILIAGGALGLLWFAFRRWGRASPAAILEEVEEVKARIEPETAQVQTAIQSASGRLIDPEAARLIGNPLVRWGKPERRRYIQGEYDDLIACLVCGRDILPGQFFWETPLIDRESGLDTGASFQLCLSCQPGDLAAVIHRDA